MTTVGLMCITNQKFNLLDKTFLTQATPPSSSTTTSGNVWDCKLF